MRRKGMLGLVLLTMIISLTGCGSSGGYKGYDSVSHSYSDEVGFSMNNSYDEGYSGNIDYSGTHISGDLVDYSYSLGSRGYVKEKETALAFYEEAQTFVDEHDGYIDNVNNTFRTNDLDADFYYYKDSDYIKYSATGCVNFNIQIEEQYTEDVIALFDDFCKTNDFAVTQFNQYATNYKSYDVVESYNEDWYHGDDITQEDLDKQLAYTSIDVSVSYSIKRPGFTVFALNVKSFFRSFWDSCGDVVSALIWIFIYSFSIFFIIALPIIKIFKKSMVKFYKKHPEYYIPKRIVLDDATTFVKSDGLKIDKSAVTKSEKFDSDVKK